MGRHRDRVLWNVLLGTGTYLLDSMKDRINENFRDVRHRARDTYETASERFGRASEAIRGEDTHYFGTAAAVLLGIGIGVGVGLLLAPASGEETRGNLAEKVQDFGSRIRNRVSTEPSGATGTYGE